MIKLTDPISYKMRWILILISTLAWGGDFDTINPDDWLESAKTKDYYAILEIPRDASPDQIKKAWRARALEMHTDLNRRGERYSESTISRLTKALALVNEAYEVLSDPQRRADYDRLGNLREGRRPQRQAYQSDDRPRGYRARDRARRAERAREAAEEARAEDLSKKKSDARYDLLREYDRERNLGRTHEVARAAAVRRLRRKTPSDDLHQQAIKEMAERFEKYEDPVFTTYKEVYREIHESVERLKGEGLRTYEAMVQAISHDRYDEYKLAQAPRRLKGTRLAIQQYIEDKIHRFFQSGGKPRHLEKLLWRIKDRSLRRNLIRQMSERVSSLDELREFAVHIYFSEIRSARSSKSKSRLARVKDEFNEEIVNRYHVFNHGLLDGVENPHQRKASVYFDLLENYVKVNPNLLGIEDDADLLIRLFKDLPPSRDNYQRLKRLAKKQGAFRRASEAMDSLGRHYQRQDPHIFDRWPNRSVRCIAGFLKKAVRKLFR